MILFFIVGGKNCTSFLHLFVLVGCANVRGVVVVDEVRWRLDVMCIISRRRSRIWLIGGIVWSKHFTIFNMSRIGAVDLFV